PLGDRAGAEHARASAPGPGIPALATVGNGGRAAEAASALPAGRLAATAVAAPPEPHSGGNNGSGATGISGGGRDVVACPYKGLAAFEAADAELFHGRERLVAELVARLVQADFLAVVGASGSGKSSVVRAGLLPALAQGVLPGSA